MIANAGPYDEAEYFVTVGVDIDCEDPTEYGLIRYMYDTAKWYDRDVMWCHVCGEESDFVLHDLQSKHAAMMSLHPFVWHPRVVAAVHNSYLVDLPSDFETFDNMSYNRSYHDKFLVVLDDTQEAYDWWNGLHDTQRMEVLNAIHSDWQNWANGNNFWVKIEKIVRDKCGECNRLLENEFVDSCGGFIGDVALEDYIKDIVGDATVYVKEEF